MEELAKLQQKAMQLRSLMESRMQIELTPGFFASSPINYFLETEGDGLNLVWSPPANNGVELVAALKSNACIVQGDVVMSSPDSRHGSVPVMGKLGEEYSDMTLQEWLQAVQNSKRKGIMVNLHTPAVVQPAVYLLASVKINGPIIVSANILGLNPNPDKHIAVWTILDWLPSRLPHCILCLGFNFDQVPLIRSNSGYGKALLDLVAGILKTVTFRLPVMFSMHALVLRNSILEVQKLLHEVPKSSLYVWSDAVNPVDSMYDILLIRESFNIDSVFYNIIKRPEEKPRGPQIDIDRFLEFFWGSNSNDNGTQPSQEF